MVDVFATRMTHLDARALPGARANEGAPEGYWKFLTTQSAMSTRGFITGIPIEISGDRKIFPTKPDEFLSPSRSPVTETKFRHIAADMATHSLNAFTASL
jgi:hypothetical protein